MASKFPQQALDDIEPSSVQQMVASLRELHQMGRPKTDEELERRIDEYFALCQRSCIRPGVESLCLSLHITRQCLYNWCAGVQCSERRQRACESAKSFIAAFIEQASMSGKVNPATAIFLQKNWLGYKDTISFEETEVDNQKQRYSNEPLSRTEFYEHLKAEFGISTDKDISEPSMPEGLPKERIDYYGNDNN